MNGQLNAMKGLLPSAVAFLLVAACASSGISTDAGPIVVFLDASQVSVPYEELGLIKQRCNRWTCKEISLESCRERLKKKAQKLGANAVLMLGDVAKGRGHAGGIPTSHSCSGVAIRLKDT